MTKLAIPKEVLLVADGLENTGFEAYLVGGCVRDIILEKKPKDWDLTTNATPEEIQKIFPETFYENTYGTVGVVGESEDPTLKVIEVTPYRKEGTYSDARRPDSVEFGVSLEEDLKRRDFTVNAIAYRPKTGEMVDLHGGHEDIKKCLIKAVGNPSARFQEDALRMMRGVRLSAELGFAIEQETAEALHANAPQLEKISKERIRDEFIRILETATPMQAIFLSHKLGLLKYIAPDIERGIGIGQNQAHSFDVFEHLLRAMQHAADKEWPFIIRLAALFHDISKPETRRWSDEKKDWTFHGHEVVGARVAKRALQDLKFPNEIIEKTTKLVRWHMFFSDPDKITLSAVRRMIVNVGQENIWDLLNLRICDRIGTGRPKEQPFRFRKYKSMVDEALRDPISVAMLAVNGESVIKILGEKPGPRVGWILHALLEEVLEDPKKNTKEYLEEKVQILSLMEDSTLKEMGEEGKKAREKAEEKELEEIRAKHHV
ncbi:MAG: HD domain-containing protein [Candidatus Pacebacteria bacterium]|nr:HD domain-containing protein [Candidatus Paceibacterota bacterium]MBP9832366.1 HD domain-containing protein [Candidatus Paceibacterota bacterium]